MRVELQPVDRFLEHMRNNSPCPSCGSSRVTVRREVASAGPVLRSECADCKRVIDVAELEPS
jgi:Fe-S cluster biogenesis protein NfuA